MHAFVHVRVVREACPNGACVNVYICEPVGAGCLPPGQFKISFMHFKIVSKC